MMIQYLYNYHHYLYINCIMIHFQYMKCIILKF